SSDLRFVVSGAVDARLELDVAAQVEAIRNVIEVAEDLRLRCVPLRPLPLLLKLVGELVGILHALDVAACAGVAVPEPGPADAASRFECSHRKAERSQAVERVESCEA